MVETTPHRRAPPRGGSSSKFTRAPILPRAFFRDMKATAAAGTLRLALSFFLTIATSVCAADEGWMPLFDGKTLDGWKASEKGGFKVVDGTIRFEGDRSHLFYNGSVRNADFKNFELQAEVWTEKGANSGIYFHTAYQEKDFPTKGFEVQVANTHVGHDGYVERKKTASLYGIRNIYETLQKDYEWFTLHITVRGKRVQVRLNDQLLVDYVQPVNPVPDPHYPGRLLSHGTFAFQGHDYDSKVAYRNIRVKPLPDDLPDYEGSPVRFDRIDEEIIRLGGDNFPLVDFHTHLKGGLTMQDVLQHTFKTGINHGVVVNGGLGFAVTNDAALDAHLRSMSGQPVFLGLQAEGREWPTLFSPAAVARFDYVFTDAMTLQDERGRRTRLWMPEEVHIEDKQAFMENLVNTTVRILDREPIDILVNPTFLPEIIARDYDQLWTRERMERVITALKRNDIALELNNRYRLPGVEFVKLAKQAGVKFTFGMNNAGPDLGRCEYGLELIRTCHLNYMDFWMPKPPGQKPVEKKGYFKANP